MMRVFTGCLVVLGLMVWLGAVPQQTEAEKPTPKLRTQIRRPIALVVQGDKLLVGNRESGSLSVIDAKTGHILAEHSIAHRIADIAPLADSLLVLDDKQNRLLNVTLNHEKPMVLSLAELPIVCSKLTVDETHHRIFLTAKWAHRVMILTLDEHGKQIRKTRTITLPFAPQELLPIASGEKLLVAEAFGNRLAVLDVKDAKISAIHEIQGHNIRGLALDEDRQSVLIAHQQIPDKALADYEEVHWGRIISNAVEVVEVSKLLDAKTTKPLKGWLDTFGDVGSAAGDPSEVLTGPEGFLAVAFSGVGEVAIRSKGNLMRVPVQSAPEAMALKEGRLFVANRLEDSISVIDPSAGKVTQTISLGPKPALTSEQRGEKLFYNAKLSHDGWMSCHSCHTDGHTAGLVVDTLGDGNYGAPKLVPSLLGTRDTQPWAWNGSLELLRGQIQQSITTTMHGDPLSTRDMEDMFAFITSLDPPPPPEPASKELLAKGRKVFKSQGCIHCHTPPSYTTPETVDVALLDEHQQSRFNPPSLRGVSHRRRFFHDGRAKSLEDVVLKIRHQQEDPIGKKDAEALLAFLRSL